MATTGICNSFKAELLQGGHSLLASQASLAGAGVSGAYTLTGLASTALLAVGMAAGGTNVGAGAIVSRILGATSVQLDTANSGTVTSGTISFTADVLKGLLIKASPSLTYSATQTNAGTPGTGSPTTANVGTDEASGTGYTSGGVTLANINPALSGTTATTQFSVNPSWTSATFSATAMIVYNASTRLGAAAAPLNNRSVAVYDFGGTQTVSSGTFTVLQPVNAAGTALIQLS
jgi:hypothetical protein